MKNAKLKLYRSISVSNLIEADKVIKNTKPNDYVFISLHVIEENNKDYVKNTELLCSKLNNKKAKIIADISKRTLDKFNCNSFITLYKKLHLYAYRFDYGFSLDEIISLSKKFPVVINASTYSLNNLKKLLNAKPVEVLAMHNFYPRRETGLDLSFFINKTSTLNKLGIKVFSFIKGNKYLRGPLFDGLLTLEKHRDISPSEAYLDYFKMNIIDGVFLGDLGISNEELLKINKINDQVSRVIKLKAKLLDKSLYNIVFTCRHDSPNNLIRIKESREYSCQGKIIEVNNVNKRIKGSITIDNKLYKRYSGEIMICKSEYPLDKKVNVIGHVLPISFDELNKISSDVKFIFIK